MAATTTGYVASAVTRQSLAKSRGASAETTRRKLVRFGMWKVAGRQIQITESESPAPFLIDEVCGLRSYEQSAEKTAYLLSRVSFPRREGGRDLSCDGRKLDRILGVARGAVCNPIPCGDVIN